MITLILSKVNNELQENVFHFGKKERKKRQTKSPKMESNLFPVLSPKSSSFSWLFYVLYPLLDDDRRWRWRPPRNTSETDTEEEKEQDQLHLRSRQHHHPYKQREEGKLEEKLKWITCRMNFTGSHTKNRAEGRYEEMNHVLMNQSSLFSVAKDLLSPSLCLSFSDRKESFCEAYFCCHHPFFSGWTKMSLALSLLPLSLVSSVSLSLWQIRQDKRRRWKERSMKIVLIKHKERKNSLTTLFLADVCLLLSSATSCHLS